VEDFFMKKAFLFVLVVVACAMTAFANGQEDGKAWPPRTVEIFTPSAPSSGTDALAQVITQYLSKSTGANAYANSSNAGGGLVSYERVRNGQKDGSELLFDTIQILLRNQIGLYEHDVWDEFTVIAGWQIYNNEPMVAVRADSPYNSLQDLLDAAKANPGTISCPTGPRGNSVHLRAIGFEQDTGCDFRLVDASGDAERITSLLGGVTDFLLTHPVMLQPYVDSGDIKYLSYLDNKRCAIVPDIPCNEELGYPVSLPSFAGLHMLVGPKDLDPAIVDSISTFLENMANDEETNELIYRLEDGRIIFQTREESIAKLKALSQSIIDFGY
jgi:tripartite-type tricarboxylate transporter receptor subunit TctC